jgi:hypothetical protein
MRESTQKLCKLQALGEEFKDQKNLAFVKYPY